jgi:RNA recognition motif-containing protein
MVNIYVGNLPYSFDDATLEETFAAFGTVETAKVIADRETGRSRGFGFVEMPNDDEAKAAIAALHDKEMDGRKLVVNEARAKR